MSWTRRLLWALGVLLLLGVAAWLGVPQLVKWQAEKQLTHLTGRQVTLGEVGFHPWSLQLTVTDLTIAAAAGSASSEPQFRLARVLVDADARSLLRLARTADGHYDIDDVLQRLAPAPFDRGDRASALLQIKRPRRFQSPAVHERRLPN